MKKTCILLTLFDHIVLSPKEMFKLLKRKGMNIKLPIKAIPNGDSGVIYVGTAMSLVAKVIKKMSKGRVEGGFLSPHGDFAKDFKKAMESNGR
jgi:hypothetical protein